MGKLVGKALAESRLNKEHYNKKGHKFTVLDYKLAVTKGKPVKYICKFDSGHVFETSYHHIMDGSPVDYGSPTVKGVGYSYRGAYKNNPREYDTWSNMLDRCYMYEYSNNKSDRERYYERGVTVCDRWLYFSSFLEDVKHLKNYDKYIKWTGKGLNPYTLDKDILIKGNLIYSPETCMFASTYEQSWAQERTNPIVAIDEYGNKYWFPSVHSCSDVLKIGNANVYSVLNKVYTHTKGYTFYRPDPNEPYNSELYDNNLIGKEY